MKTMAGRRAAGYTVYNLMLRILLTGGGTGGHIYPLIAVTEELEAVSRNNQFSLKLFYLGACGIFRAVLANDGIRVLTVPGGKFRAYASLENFTDPLKVVAAFFKSLFTLYFIMPDILFSKGGPGALPVVLAARFYRIPVLVHDSDAVPGKTSQITARFASQIATSFPEAAKYFRKNAVCVGNPVRQSLLVGRENREHALQHFGFDPNLPLLLVLGASQGAQGINDFILNNLEALVSRYQILHQVGIGNESELTRQRRFLLEKMPREAETRYRITPFLDEDYATALSAADLIVGRAGAGLIFEIAAFGKPAVLIPLPQSAREHQRENAYAYAAGGGAIVIEQENLLPTLFVEQVEKIFGDRELYIRMSVSAQKFARPEAGRLLAEEILRLAGKHLVR